VNDVDLEERVGRLGDTSVGVVPGEEGSEETKDTTSLDETNVRVCALVWADEMAETEHEEGQVEGEEEKEEGDGGLHGAEEKQEGEDEPAHEVESENVLQLRGSVGFRNAKGTSVDDGPRDPETTVGGESSGGKGVAASHFPHTSKKLNQSTVTVSQPDNNGWSRDSAGLQVEERKNESGQGEGGKTERSWVGELAEAWLIGRNLHLTTKWWEELSALVHENLANWAMGWVVNSLMWNIGERVVVIHD
jgi:hypothetical protein